MASMDNPSGHVSMRLLDPVTFVTSSASVPLRNPTDTFKQFNSDTGHAIVRGRDDHHFDNPRVFGKFNFLMINKYFKNYIISKTFF